LGYRIALAIMSASTWIGGLRAWKREAEQVSLLQPPLKTFDAHNRL